MAIQVVSFHCVLKNKLGRIISSTYNNNVLTQSQGSDITLGALSEALKNLRKGEKRRISLRADQAYGYYNPKLVIVRPLEQLAFEGDVRLGEQVTYVTEEKEGLYRVVEISEDSVTLDGNHPLAGQDLVFEIEATAVREATPEDLDEIQCDEDGRYVH